MCRLAVIVADVASRCVIVCFCPSVLAHRVHIDACSLSPGVSSGQPTSRSRVIVAVDVALFTETLVCDSCDCPRNHQSMSIVLLLVKSLPVQGRRCEVLMVIIICIPPPSEALRPVLRSPNKLYMNQPTHHLPTTVTNLTQNSCCRYKMINLIEL